MYSTCILLWNNPSYVIYKISSHVNNHVSVKVNNFNKFTIHMFIENQIQDKCLPLELTWTSFDAVAGLHRLPPRQASGRSQQAGKVRPRLEFDAVFPSSKTTLKSTHLTCCSFCLESLKSTADDSKVSSKTRKPGLGLTLGKTVFPLPQVYTSLY